MKNCPNCGIEMADGDLFCTVCGSAAGPAPEVTAGAAVDAVAEAAPEVVSEAVPEVSPEAAPAYSAPVNPAPAAAPAYAPPVNTAPAVQLKTSRGLVKFILLSIITLGIYALVVYCKLSTEINITASKYDGKKTMHFALVWFLLGPITLEIFTLVWMHKFCARTGAELKRRGIDYSFGAGTFWGWGVLGCLIIVGPFVFIHKLLKSFNLINADYNEKG